MKKLSIALLMMLATFACCSLWADSTQNTPAMMDMGAPPEMKEVAWMVGTWDVVNQEKAPGSTEWKESKAECEFSYALDGAAMTFNYRGNYMGGPFNGQGIKCWDRFNKQWQMVWTDNMSGMLVMYTGQKQENNMVLTAKTEMMGQAYWARITISNMTPTSYDWSYEDSMDSGKSWNVSVKSKYTKRK
jgi:hypothetical protein